MKKLKTVSLVICLLLAILSGCTHKNMFNGRKIAMPDYYRKITGFDSIQLVFGGRATYNEAKQDYDVTWDSLYAHFYCPNKWESEKFKKDTVFIHDTIYTHRNYGNVKTLNQY